VRVRRVLKTDLFCKERSMFFFFKWLWIYFVYLAILHQFLFPPVKLEVLHICTTHVTEVLTQEKKIIREYKSMKSTHKTGSCSRHFWYIASLYLAGRSAISQTCIFQMSYKKSNNYIVSRNIKGFFPCIFLHCLYDVIPYINGTIMFI